MYVKKVCYLFVGVVLARCLAKFHLFMGVLLRRIKTLHSYFSNIRAFSTCRGWSTIISWCVLPIKKEGHCYCHRTSEAELKKTHAHTKKHGKKLQKGANFYTSIVCVLYQSMVLVIIFLNACMVPGESVTMMPCNWLTLNFRDCLPHFVPKPSWCVKGTVGFLWGSLLPGWCLPPRFSVWLSCLFWCVSS